MISAQAAKNRANSHLRAEGSHLVVLHASRNKKYGVWTVAYSDPDHLNEVLDGGALVVTDEGEVHAIGSTPDAVDHLMESLGRSPAGLVEKTWSRERENLPVLADAQHPWPEELGDELAKPYFRDLMEFVDHERRTGAVYPPAADLFRAFHLTPYDQVKVVILGQDPYHQPGQANGLCFSVPRDVPRLPPSLRNIHAAMTQDGFAPPPHGDLTEWARQGVLLLNTALTVRDSEANSHSLHWRPFTEAVMSTLNARQRPIVFVLWGNSAHRERDLIDEARHVVLTAPHPAARGRYQAEFRNAGTFSEVNRLLEAHEVAPIRWAIA